MRKALVKTEFNFPGQKSVYHGKVRDVYNINDELLAMVATDRISAFDVILPEGIPYKGQMLNQIMADKVSANSRTKILFMGKSTKMGKSFCRSSCLNRDRLFSR